MKLTTVLLLMCFSLSLSAQEGKVIENQILQSNIVDYEVHYSVYLPPNYEQNERSYPVIYLLHGYSDKETAWVQYAMVNRTMDRLIAEGKVPPAIIVMPDAKVTWYVNRYDGKDPYMDMFVQEFVPQIEELYRIRKEKRYRAVSGLSMGGHGALVLTLKYPELFGSCAAFSAAVYTDNEMLAYLKTGEKGWFKPIFGGLNEDGSLSAYYRENSVLSLLKATEPSIYKHNHFYIDCGDDDFLYQGNAALHILMRQQKIDHEYRIHDGGHAWMYWRTHITEGLIFMGDVFSKIR